MAKSSKTGDTTVLIEPPRFDRPEVEIQSSARRKKTGTAHWSGSRIIVQIPANVRGKDRTMFVDELVERLLTQRPQVAAQSRRGRAPRAAPGRNRRCARPRAAGRRRV